MENRSEAFRIAGEGLKQLEVALKDAAKSANIEASNCRTECSVSIGPDGKPVVTCKVVCDWP